MIDVSGITQETITSVAVATDGYSGREISKLAIAWQAAAYGTDSAVLNAEMFLQVLEESKESKRQKKRWLSDKEIENLTTI
jgi:ATPase family AAA domain-containing protein 3A/B